MLIESATLCLALNIYHEARGESLEGQKAVAAVTLNRSKRKSERICHEVFKPFQFSWTIEWVITSPIVDIKAFAKAKWVAEQSLKATQDNTGGATHYHAINVYPKWASKLVYVGQIGQHHFYR